VLNQYISEAIQEFPWEFRSPVGVNDRDIRIEAVGNDRTYVLSKRMESVADPVSLLER
jgi:hypothetical protein